MSEIYFAYLSSYDGWYCTLGSEVTLVVGVVRCDGRPWVKRESERGVYAGIEEKSFRVGSPKIDSPKINK